MKGYYIDIKNNLLEGKHRKAMGESVWLFMWLIDHQTSANEQGVGKVLGGKPITYAEVNKDLGISESSYSRWVVRLRNAGYIITTRTPNGLVFYVNKAKKGERSVKNDVSLGSDPPNSGMQEDPPNSGMQIKTTQSKPTQDNPKGLEQAPSSPSFGNKDINTCHEHFTSVVGGSLDGSQKWNRRFCYLLLKKMKSDYPEQDGVKKVKALIDLAHSDPFHARNATSFEYLHKNMRKIIQTVKVPRQ